MTKLALDLAAVETLQRVAAERNLETCAVGFVSQAGSAGRFVVREFAEVPPHAYIDRTALSVALSPAYCVELANRARTAGMGIALAHTHPGELALEGFSAVDDRGEIPLAEYFGSRVSKGHHFALVVTAKAVHARRLGQRELVAVAAVGADRRTFESLGTLNEPSQRHDRQVRAFGLAGQAVLQDIIVAIVGLGGTGSVVAQQLAHLGVRRFLLVDPDAVEETNLNRLVGSTPSDVGVEKVRLAALRIQAINPHAECVPIAGDVADSAVANELLNADFIFGCTDSMASRAVINQLAYQYLIPCVDMGVAIHVEEGVVKSVSGRAQMLSSGLPCLVCTDLLDAQQVRREMMTPEQRRRDPYIVGADVTQPAVVSLNSAVASIAVSTFLSAVASFPQKARMVVYDAVRGSMRPTVMTPRPHCIVCSTDGALARGDTWSLPTRHEHPNS